MIVYRTNTPSNCIYTSSTSLTNYSFNDKYFIILSIYILFTSLAYLESMDALELLGLIDDDEDQLRVVANGDNNYYIINNKIFE